MIKKQLTLLVLFSLLFNIAVAQETLQGPIEVSLTNGLGAGMNVGELNTVTSAADFSLTFGKSLTTSNWGSVNFGYLNEVSGQSSMAVGYDSDASGFTSFAFGTFNKASNDYTQAFGKSCIASGQLSTAIGEGVHSEAQYNMAVGRFNIGGGSSGSWVATDPLFEIGNGSNNANRSNAFTVLKNGYVGIGTSTPDEILTVKGIIHAERVKVDLNFPAPDYVFADNYELRTIEEVEQYIETNYHLPEIPSAVEMESQGIEVGEMNMLLLQKIEELTLYIIDQQKQIDELKERY